MKLVDLTPVFQAIISVVSVIALLYLVPFIKRKVSAEKLDQILRWVETLVACADQIYERHEGAEKKQYVIDRLTTILAEHGLLVDLTVLEDLVEAEVLRLHSELKAEGVYEEDFIDEDAFTFDDEEDLDLEEEPLEEPEEEGEALTEEELAAENE